MTELKATQKGNKTNHGSRKGLVAALCVALLFAVLIVIFLAAKDPIIFSYAKTKAENSDFSSAAEVAGMSDNEKAEQLSEYAALRIDINECYPTLLSEYDAEKIRQWKETAARISENGSLLGETISADITALYQTLDNITQSVSAYESLRSDVLSMMDVFLEINRLHTKAEDGKNVGFTVKEEREKIRKWEQQCDALEEYAQSIPGFENIYLLNFLVKEVQGECTDLSETMDTVIESGYSETDFVRFSGQGRKTYPDIRSSTESVNLLEKNNYELFVYKSVCRALVESLGEFYTP